MMARNETTVRSRDARHPHRWRALVTIWIGLSALAAWAGDMTVSTTAQVDAILKHSKAPPGVVFEIVTRSPGALDWAIPEVRQQAARLRARFPQLPLAVVSHGREELALQNAQRTEHISLQQQIQSLVRNDDIAFHVCGTYAERKGLAPEDFPAYIDVAPEGPAQIENYQALGYIKVRVRRDQQLTLH